MGVHGANGTQPLECIDMASPDKHSNAARVRKACVTSGFFYIVNHGVDPGLLEEVFTQSKKFFSLPLEEKMKVIHDKNHRGYTPFEEEILDPDTQSKGDSKEGYYVGVPIPESDPRSRKPLHGPNQYPSPDVLPGWQETMDHYHSELIKLSKRVSRLIALALNLEETYFEKPGITDDPMASLRLLHYSDEKSNVELGIYGTGAHSDYGLITLLATDDVPGLQICRDKTAVPQVWEDVPPMKGAYIVNLGDMLERWSNGLFRSTLHRVVSQGIERYSIPFFFEPNYDCLVECLPTCCSENNPPKYPPMTSGNHLLSKYKQTHKGFVSDQKLGSSDS
jgi:isopenicillin N synthase-like dioxygenase